MAHRGVHLDRKKKSSSICLDPLKDPVAVPCGHSSISLLLLLLLLPGTLAGSKYQSNAELVPIQVEVQNTIDKTPPRTYDTLVACRGILLGALKRLTFTNVDFKFTYTEDLNYGPYLESVNGVAGNDKEHTYWELLVQTPDGKITRPDVGIGCYLPKKHEKIILNFKKWSECWSGQRDNVCHQRTIEQ